MLSELIDILQTEEDLKACVMQPCCKHYFLSVKPNLFYSNKKALCLRWDFITEIRKQTRVHIGLNALVTDLHKIYLLNNIFGFTVNF